MSSQLKKKNKKKKKKIIEEEIVPKKHERIGNLNLYSEEVSKNILEKIISLVLSTSLNKNIEQKLGDICFQATRSAVNNLIELTHVNHDADDFDIDKIEIHSYIKYYNTDSNIKRYSMKRHNIAWKIRNEKVEYDLNKSQKIDDKPNKSIIIENNKYFSKGKIYQYDINITKNNFWGSIPCPKITDMDRTSAYYNIYIPRKEENKMNINETKKMSKVLDKNKMFIKKNTFSYRNFISNLSKRFNLLKDDKQSKFLEVITQKKRAPQMIDLPSYPLENIEVRKELDNIDDLRKEALEFTSKKEKSTKKKYVFRVEKTKEEIEKEKKIKKGNFTYDNEGNLIIINEIRQDRFSKEFWPIMSKPIVIKPPKTLEAYKKEKIKMENHAEKNIEYNKEDNKLSSFLIKARLTQPLINLSELNDSLKDAIKDINQNNLNLNNPKNKIDDLLLLNNINKPKIEPSGSNFKLINPSVGVNVKEKNKQKSGGVDFYKEFHKYSLNDFNKTLQDNIEWTKIKFKENNNEEFNSTAKVELPNLKKSNFIKNMIKEEKEKDHDTSELNPINVKYDFNHKIYNRKTRKRIIDNKNNFENTTTSASNIKNNNNIKRSMAKSTSEIFLDNEKFMKLKNILFHDNDDKINRIIPYNKRSRENDNLFVNRNQSSIRNRKKKVLEIRKKFNDVDNLNKNIITGKNTQITIKNPNMVLPKLSLKNNETNFNRTMINFVRERTKKVMWEEYVQKKENNNKRKKNRKINSVKLND